MQIRPALIDDAAGIAALSARSWQATYPGIIPDALLQKLIARQGSVEYWQPILRATHRLYFTYVCEEETGKIVGCATFGPERRKNRDYKGELYSLYLLPEFQGRGLGRALVAAAAFKLIQEGMTSMLVWVLPENQTARGFYEHLGGAWLCKGEFQEFSQTLEALAYGWRDIRPLAASRQRNENMASVETVQAKAGVLAWCTQWLGRRRRT